MHKLTVGLVIFAAGLSLGGLLQRHWHSEPDAERASITPVPTPVSAEGSRGPLPAFAVPGSDLRQEVARLLQDDAFQAAVERYEALRATGDDSAAQRAREQILARARVLIAYGAQGRAEQLLQLYLLNDHRDPEARMLLADAYSGRRDFRQAIDQLYEARGYAYLPAELERLTRRIRLAVADQVAVLKQAGDQAALLELYQHLAQLEPSYAPYFLGLAEAQLALEDSAAARRSLQLVAQDPDVGSHARFLLEQLSAAEAPGSDTDTSALAEAMIGVPLHRSGNNFLVDARLGNAHSVRLLVDTGASMTILTPETLERSRVRYTDTGSTRVFNTANGQVRAPVYQLDALAVGDWQVSQLEVGVLELAGSTHIDGLLGMNFLRHFQFFIDQNEAVLRLSIDP